jgi:photosystem II stability/assembly factor-like uncharacterized protein
MDGNKLMERTCAEQQESVQETGLWLSAFGVLGQSFIGQQTQTDISDLRFNVVNETGNTARVRVTGQIRTAVLAVAQTQEVDEEWLVVQEDGKWKWCGYCTVEVTREIPVTRVVTATPVPTPTPTATPEAPRLWSLTGLDGEAIHSIVVGTDGAIYAASYGDRHGVFESSDGGATWTAINNGLGDLDVYLLAIALENPDILFAMTRSSVWRTTDGGQTWFPIGSPYHYDPDRVGPVAPISPDGRQVLGIGRYTETYISYDAGASWEVLTEEFGWCDIIHPAVSDPQTVYCLSTYDLGGAEPTVFKSSDGGGTWWECASVGAGYDLTRIAVSSETPEVLFAGTVENGIYRSTDGCGSWIPVNGTLPNQGSGVAVYALTIDPMNPARLYAALGEYGLYESTNSGEMWQPIDVWSPRGAHTVISAIALSKNPSGQIYLGTNGFGVWKL